MVKPDCKAGRVAIAATHSHTHTQRGAGERERQSGAQNLLLKRQKYP